MKKAFAPLAFLLALTATSCKNPVDAGVDLALADITDFAGIFTGSDGMTIELHGSSAYIRTIGSTKYTSGSLSISPKVGESVMIGMAKASPGTYRGSIVGKTGFLGSANEAVLTSTALTSNTDFVPLKTMTRASSSTGGTFAGGWRRVSDIYDTDIQIGIPGEGPARIYLCTLKPSVQLVKGTVMADGSTIKWDMGSNAPPDYDMRSSGGNMQLYVFGTLGGTYTRGSWRNGSCGVSF